MDIVEDFSATRPSFDQSLEGEPRVWLPPCTMRTKSNHPKRKLDQIDTEGLMPCIQSANIYPASDFRNGADDKCVGYISRAKIPEAITRRGTKGSNKIEGNRIFNRKLRATREGWWRQERLKKAQARGLPWGTEAILYQVHVSSARTDKVDNEIPSAQATNLQTTSRARGDSSGASRQRGHRSDAADFQTFINRERARKRTQFKGFSSVAKTSRDPLPAASLAAPSPNRDSPAPGGNMARDFQMRMPAKTAVSSSFAPSPNPPTSHLQSLSVDTRLDTPHIGSPHLPASQQSFSPQIVLSQGINDPLHTKHILHPDHFNPHHLTSHQPTTSSKVAAENFLESLSLQNMAPRVNGTQSSQPPQTLLTEEWRRRESLEVFLSGLPPYVETVDIWNALKDKGKIVSIDIYADRKNATVKFRPPPKEDFFSRQGSRIGIDFSNGLSGYRLVSVRLGRENRPRPEERSPVKRTMRTFYPEILGLEATGISFGARVTEDTMAVLRSVRSTYTTKVEIILNVARKQLIVKFAALVNDTKRQFRFTVALSDMHQVLRVDHEDGRLSIVLDLLTPPPYYREFDEGSIPRTHTAGSLVWREEDSWYRQTSIEASSADMEALRSMPTSLKKNGGFVDIGRWKTFQLSFDSKTMNSESRERLQTISNALDDFNVSVQLRQDFKFISGTGSVFGLIDPPSLSNHVTNTHALFEPEMFYLPFPVRYQLEVCISNGCLSEYNLDRSFVKKLIELTNVKLEKATSLLEHVADSQKCLYDPMKIFELPEWKFRHFKAKIPAHCNLIRTAVITATTIRYNSPTVEMTNRIIRHFANDSDRFLRVRFEDDIFRGSSRIHATQANTLNEVFTRIKRTLNNGIMIGDRHYEFLAFGNSQLREHGAYFFASAQHLTAANIRAWMGEFSQERNVAKHAARIGQCFSTTRAILQVHLARPKREDLIPDIKRNGYTFSDGVGKMSPILASYIAKELSLNKTSPPSCYQFRQGGCKGVLAVDPGLKLFETRLRESQFKFDAQHYGLEIIRCSEFWSASLNRQIIPILSFLGVSDDVFLYKQKELVDSLARAMEDDTAAVDALRATLDPNHMTMTLSQMVSEGFRKVNEPFVISLLRLWRAWSMKYLKEKAKITIRQGAFVLGVLDETATLQGHFDGRQPKSETASIQEKLDALPEIFIQVERPDSEGKYEIVEGLCFLARNPSLHPGDIRVVRAVNCPQLHHLRDVVVLPQTGDRDLSSMCSGGDLDGDDYIVVWDPELVPRNWFYKPMDFSTAGRERMPEKDVTLNDTTTFFVNYIKNDFLGMIAHAHVAWANDPLGGLEHPKCLELARLHSDAVDFNKSGVPARWSRADNPKYWPHFMEKKGRRSRRSGMVLGQLYDAVEKIAFVPNYDAPFDGRVLSAYEVSDVMLKQAKDLKEQYDEALQRIMSQHEIKTEFEVWSTFVLDHSKASKDYKFHEEIGRLASVLKDRFRKACADAAGGEEFSTLAPFVTAMYKVTQTEAELGRSEVEAGQRDDMPFISFPWLFHTALGDIANGRRHTGKAFVSKGSTSKVQEGFEVTTGLDITAEKYKSFAGGMEVEKVSFDPYEDVEAFSKPKSLQVQTDTVSNEAERQSGSLIEITPTKTNVSRIIDQQPQQLTTDYSLPERRPSSSLLDDLDNLPEPTSRRQSTNEHASGLAYLAQFDGHGSLSGMSSLDGSNGLTSLSTSSLDDGLNGSTTGPSPRPTPSSTLVGAGANLEPKKMKPTSRQTSDPHALVFGVTETNPIGPYVSRFRRRNADLSSTTKSKVTEDKRMANFEAWEKANQAALESRKLSAKTKVELENENVPEPPNRTETGLWVNESRELQHGANAGDLLTENVHPASKPKSLNDRSAMRPPSAGGAPITTLETNAMNDAQSLLSHDNSAAPAKVEVENQDRRPFQTSQVLSSLLAHKDAPTKAEDERSAKAKNDGISRLSPKAPTFTPWWQTEIGFGMDEDGDEYKYEELPDPAEGTVDPMEALRAMNRGV